MGFLATFLGTIPLFQRLKSVTVTPEYSSKLLHLIFTLLHFLPEQKTVLKISISY